jgi:hypothetical protein
MNGSNGSTSFTDSSSNNLAVTVSGNAKISTAQSKYDGASLVLGGGSDRLTTAFASALGTDDYTIEAWVYLNSNAQTQPLVCIGDSGQSSGIVPYVTNTGKFALFGNNSSLLVGTTQTVSASSWVHLAFAREGGTMRLFVNGVQDGSVSNTSNYSNASIRVGSELYNGAQGSAFNGYIDDLRVTKGVARYTANFTPPIAPFPDA